MKTLSIKHFLIMTVSVLLISEMIIFYCFYISSKVTISDLVRNNIQSDMLRLEHFMEKNLKFNNINQLVSYLDNIASGSNLIQDIHVINTKDILIYSTDRGKGHKIESTDCVPISKINSTDVFEQKCYLFSIKLYKGLEPHYFKSHIYIDENYLENLLSDRIHRFGIYFAIFFIVFVSLLWVILSKILITPLEKLRQFAYYSTKTTKELFIRELESIRYSLDLTFNRLKKEQKELFKLSTRDSLSGLYNRLSLIEKINWFISKNRRSKNEFAIIFLDLDNFKNINDTKGHDVGDKILKYISRLLKNTVRENDIVSRIGGDEFVVVLPDIVDNMTIIEVIQRIKAVLLKPIELNHNVYSITASMGVTIYPKDGEDTTSLLKNADMAMYKAKELGKDGYYFFTDSLNKRMQEKVYIQKLMTNGLKNGYFKLFYQPKIDIKTSKIVSCEALIRLIDPIEGLIPPDKFISLAEESSFIIPLGEWVIREATKKIKEWEGTPLERLKVSVNVSAVQFKDSQLFPLIKECANEVNPYNLDIELTESVLMSNFDENIKIIDKIKELGISISLDDFGTGYSSLSYLKTIPFDTIKIDKSFIDDLEKSEQEKLFINMIVNISKELGLAVVAEGVETEAQLRYLESIGCDLYQGYLCSKPLQEEEFEKFFTMYNNKSAK